jgi:hypothetical protein
MTSPRGTFIEKPYPADTKKITITNNVIPCNHRIVHINFESTTNSRNLYFTHLLYKTSTMIQATAQSIIKRAPQQAARIQNAARSITTDSFAFYPVQKNRVRMVTPKTNRECFGYYPSNVAVQKTQCFQSALIKDLKAVRAALMQLQKKQASKKSLKTWESVMQTMQAVKKTTTTALS